MPSAVHCPNCNTTGSVLIEQNRESGAAQAVIVCPSRKSDVTVTSTSDNKRTFLQGVIIPAWIFKCGT